MFDDHSDDDEFLSNLVKKSTQKSSVLLAGKAVEPYRKDLTSMQYGGAPVGRVAMAPTKAVNRQMFDDDSDDDEFLSNLVKKSTQKSSVPLAGKVAAPYTKDLTSMQYGGASALGKCYRPAAESNICRGAANIFDGAADIWET